MLKKIVLYFDYLLFQASVIFVFGVASWLVSYNFLSVLSVVFQCNWYLCSP